MLAPEQVQDERPVVALEVVPGQLGGAGVRNAVVLLLLETVTSTESESERNNESDSEARDVRQAEFESSSKIIKKLLRSFFKSGQR